jgi:hypothetical protein
MARQAAGTQTRARVRRLVGVKDQIIQTINATLVDKRWDVKKRIGIFGHMY